MKALRFCTVILLALITVACSGSQRREAVDLPESALKVSLDKIWSQSLGDPRGGTLSPVGTDDGRVCGASAYCTSTVVANFTRFALFSQAGRIVWPTQARRSRRQRWYNRFLSF